MEKFSGQTSGYNRSYWIESTTGLAYESLDQNLSADVVVVGGGISGLSVAYFASKAGLEVIVLEDGNIGSGETGRTSAHLNTSVDDLYHHLEKQFGEKKTALIAESYSKAIDAIEEIVAEEHIYCDFERVDGYLFLHPTDDIKTLYREHDTANKFGLNTQMLSKAPGIVEGAGPCLKFPRQAQFHPLKYLKGLCEAIKKRGGKIFTNTHVDKVAENRVEAGGFTVAAKSVVVATNTPVNDIFTMHTKQFAYRTYVSAAKIPKNTIEKAQWWDTGNQNSVWLSKPYHYVRVHPCDSKCDLLICGGEDHRTGQSEKENISEEERYRRLELWVKEYFPTVDKFEYRWSGQVMQPLDSVGFIGRNPGSKNIYIVTGDSGDGLTNGTIAGMLIKDLIVGNENPWAEVYDPSRIALSKGGDYITEMGDMVAQYADYLTSGDVKSIDELKPDEGAVIRSGMGKIAVYKSSDNKVNAFSAVCPHLGCSVHWNADEKSFDCPCHGSRFSALGKVVNGPADRDLKSVNLREEVLTTRG